MTKLCSKIINFGSNLIFLILWSTSVKNATSSLQGNKAIHKEMTEIYYIMPRISSHDIPVVTGKRRMRSERSWRSRKPSLCPETTSSRSSSSHALDTGFLQLYGRLRELVHQPRGDAQAARTQSQEVSQ